MSKIPTAEEFLWDNEEKGSTIWSEDVYPKMIEFAKLHVQEALDSVLKESLHGDKEHQDWLINKFSSYNLNNIK
jgi:hypothetical protein